MNILTIVGLAVALATDAFAVSVTIGAAHRKPAVNHAFRAAFAFGVFQAVMPILGWLVGLGFVKAVEDYDHWIAFGLLGVIGSKMIYESFKIKEVEKRFDLLNIRTLLILAVATSIDAFAVGVTFSFLLAGSVMMAVIIIGSVTFTLSYVGVYIGKSMGHLFESAAEVLGGVILIGIGTKILLAHILV